MLSQVMSVLTQSVLHCCLACDFGHVIPIPAYSSLCCRWTYLSAAYVTPGRVCLLSLDMSIVQQPFLPLVLSVVEQTDSIDVYAHVHQQPMMPLDVSVLKQPVLSMDLSVLQQTVLPWSVLVLTHPKPPLHVSVLQQYSRLMSLVMYGQATSSLCYAASGRICPKAACAAWTCLISTAGVGAEAYFLKIWK